jgi:hypothetical protein
LIAAIGASPMAAFFVDLIDPGCIRNHSISTQNSCHTRHIRVSEDTQSIPGAKLTSIVSIG